LNAGQLMAAIVQLVAGSGGHRSLDAAPGSRAAALFSGRNSLMGWPKMQLSRPKMQLSHFW
jgi:hypothetical protein